MGQGLWRRLLAQRDPSAEVPEGQTQPHAVLFGVAPVAVVAVVAIGFFVLVARPKATPQVP